MGNNDTTVALLIAKNIIEAYEEDDGAVIEVDADDADFLAHGVVDLHNEVVTLRAKLVEAEMTRDRESLYAERVDDWNRRIEARTVEQIAELAMAKAQLMDQHGVPYLNGDLINFAKDIRAGAWRKETDK